jgi:hypothetical protein
MGAQLELLYGGYSHSVWDFALVTVMLGGSAALLAGRAIAAAWRPWWHVAVSMLLISAAARFLHFALFGGTLLSLPSYVLDAAVCLLFGFLGFRLMRVSQMVTSYDWINERAGVFAWRRRGAPSESG